MPDGSGLERIASALAFLRGGLLLPMLLISPALPAANIVEVNTLQQAQDLGFREPVGDYSDGNLDASKTQGDAKGGDLALIMELSEGSPRATIAYRVGGLSKLEVSNLGSISLDYFVTKSLTESGNDLALKLRCSNNTSITHSLENLEAGQWVEHTIELAKAKFYRTVDGVVVTKPLGPGLPSDDNWTSVKEDWCSGLGRSIVDIQIGAGSSAGIEGGAQVFVDYIQMGSGTDTYNFELPETTPEEESPEFHIFITNAIVSAEEVSTYLAKSGLVSGFNGEAQADGTYRVRAKFDWKRNQAGTDCPTTGDPFVQGLVSVEQFGLNSETGDVNQIADGDRAFRCLKQLTGGDGFRDLDTSKLTTMKSMFSRAWRFDEWIGHFDTSGVTDFSYVFDDAKAFNQDISAWNTSKATTMYQMFYGALAFNGDIRTGEERTPEGGESYVPWTVSSVRDMGQMFYNANAFNQPIGNWDVSSVVPATACNENFSCNKGMSAMFASARIFNQDLSSWDVSAFGGQPVDNVNGLEFDQGARAWTGINPDTGVAWCNDGKPRWDGAACAILPPVVSQCNAGDQNITVVFDADPGGAGNVTNVAYSIDGGVNYTTRSPASAASPLVLSNLTNGTSYSVLIKSIAGEDESAPEANCTVTPFGQASAPRNLIATAGDGLITVDFDPPADTNGDVITHYEHSLDGSAFVSSGSDTPSITVTGLTNGTTYSIKVRATGAVPGQEAGPVTGKPLSSTTEPEQPKAPGRPSGVALAGANQALSVSFNAAAANGSAITDYEYSLDGADFKSSGVTTSPFTIGGLTNGQSYTVALRARNAAGVGPATSPVAGTPVTVPGAPTNLIATPGDTQAFVAFTAPADNGADITDYEYRVDGGAAVSTGDVTPSITVTGLNNGTSYQIEVRAENSKGTGAWSTAVSVTPESGAEPPDAPTITGAFRVNNDIFVEFTAGEDNGAEITDYEYRVAPNGAFTSAGVTVSPITLASQNPADGIRVSIRAVNAEGPGPDSALWLVPAEKPFPPQGNVRAELTLVGSECDIEYAHASGAPAGMSAGLDVQLDFGLENCDAGESVTVSIDLGANLPDGARAHKVNSDGTFTEIEGATYTATSVSYVIEDDQGQGDYTGLDRNPQATVVEDPIVIMVPLPPPSVQPTLPVPLPYWLLIALMGSVGWMGYRRQSAT